jgi:hypothetical protein
LTGGGRGSSGEHFLLALEDVEVVCKVCRISVNRYHQPLAVVDLEPGCLSEGIQDELLANDRPRIRFHDDEGVVRMHIAGRGTVRRCQGVQHAIIRAYQSLQHVGDEKE